MNRYKSALKGFTLIELLIVIAILGILIIALLVTMNPIEAQRKARDTKRLADLSKLNTILNQYVNDTAVIPAITVTSASAGAVYTGVPCASSWLTVAVNTCAYAPTIPTDPINNRAGVTVQGTATTQTMAYGVTMTAAGLYEITVFVESATNLNKVTGDGGAGATQAYTVEAGTDLALR